MIKVLTNESLIKKKNLTGYGKQHSRTRSSMIRTHRYATKRHTHSRPFYLVSEATCSREE
jgi:hypothetical protein